MADLHLVGNILPDRAIVIVQVEQQVSWCTDLQRTQCHGLRLLDVGDGQMLASGDDVLHLVQISAIEERLHTIHHFIYNPFAKQRYEQPSEETRQPTSLARLWYVAPSAVLPLPYLLGYKQSVQEENHLMLQPLEPLLPRNLVERKDVDKDTLMHVDMLECGFREARPVHADLHEVERRMRLCVGRLQEKAVAEFLLCHLGKTLVVRTHHANVDIVVPGQHLLPEVSTDGRATRHEVADVVLPADAVHLAERLVECILKPLKFLLFIPHLLV